ncbi:MAG TPA: hypothetical protein VK448_08940 [Dissulfurispiraceae bacterium]|nr:hypothetical protein [Dissulfurispiraceae bacterium]
MASSKKHLGLGIVMAIGFFVILFLTFSPIFPKSAEGKAQNGLEWADETFNRLSKGSSYFIPKVTKDAEKFVGKPLSITVKMTKDADKPGDAEKRAVNASKVFIAAGANVTVTGSELKVEGDLGKILLAALRDSDAMYKNDGNYIKTKYGADDEKKQFRQWHNAFTKFDKALKKEGKIEEANIISDVTKKAVETAYNYYTVDAIQVKDKAGLMTFLLVFYVAYTMWWGFSIFFMFEGLGLSMKKAKEKKEV